MLTLTRKAGQRIVVGPPERPIGIITVRTLNDEKVKLVFDFARDIEINREELAAAKAETAAKAAKAGKPE